MKKILFLSFYLFCLTAFSQNSISGTVTDNQNQALEGASVYINNTTIGVSTGTNGAFELNLKEGTYELIVSYVGYKTVRFSLNTKKYTKPLLFKLIIEENVLNEVEITKTIYNDEWKSNLSIFKRAFIGKTKLAKECKILNPKVLHFEFNLKTGELTGFAKEPLQIKHSGLGYLITYDLVGFSLKRKSLHFSGYSRYRNLRKSIRKKWKRNRLESYNGSQMHFLRNLLSKNIKEDGFMVNQFRRELNPERPSDKKIKMAREFIQLQGNGIDFSKGIKNPKTPLDSALVAINKSKLPKYLDYLYKTKVPIEQMVSSSEKGVYLDFENYLSVIYTKEPEEENYLIDMFGRRKKATGMQTSNIVLTDKKSLIDFSGILVSPNALFVEGYWGFESFANMLPLDYQPSKN